MFCCYSWFPKQPLRVFLLHQVSKALSVAIDRLWDRALLKELIFLFHALAPPSDLGELMLASVMNGPGHYRIQGRNDMPYFRRDTLTEFFTAEQWCSFVSSD